MGSAIGGMLGNAVGVAISPVPIIAVILMLFSGRALANSTAFLAGWVIGLSLVGGIVLAVGFEASSGGESGTGGFIKIVIGVLFLLLAMKQWIDRPREDEEPSMPGWMASIDDFTAVRSLGIGFVLSAVNPKNLGLTIAAVASISASGLTTGQEIATLIVYLIIASITVAVPVVLNAVLGERAQEPLGTMRAWLVANNNVVMVILFVVLGAKVLGDGLAAVG